MSAEQFLSSSAIVGNFFFYTGIKKYITVARHRAEHDFLSYKKSF
jgi:hypothetical protein